jgi:prepilin-type N-terminal cleavage/methylation domain-containing protein
MRDKLRIKNNHYLYPWRHCKALGTGAPERRTPNAERYFFNRSGFTTIEFIVSIVILGILGVYTFSFLGSTMGAYVRVQEHKILVDEGRLAMEHMIREIRDANQNASITTTTSSITFTKVHPSSATITYSLTSGTLNRVYGGTFALAGNVQTFSPTVSGSAPNQVVTLDMTLSGRGTVRFRTKIYPRTYV